jgi:anti-sigma-K factor RskA
VRLTRHDDLHVLTGSYALDALSPRERDSFERHLARCASCAAEVRGLRETAARLAMAWALRPPPRLQARVLAAACRTRQLPPRPGASRLARDRWRRAPRLLLATSAASMAAAVTIGVTQVVIRPQQAPGAAVSRVEQAPDARTQIMPASVGGAVTLVISLRLKEAVVTAAGMPAPSGSRVYQLWVIGPGGARPAGFVTAGPVLAAGIGPGDRIGITVEPAGGASRPTTKLVVMMPV